MGLSLLATVLGFGINLVVGKPEWAQWPVRFISKYIAILEKILNDGHPQAKKRERNPKNEYLWGIVMAVLVTITGAGLIKLILVLLNMLHPLAAFVVEAFICWQLFTTKNVFDAGTEIYEKLRKDDMEALDEAAITKKTVKAMLVDMLGGTVAPMFYMMLGGATLGVLYTVIYVMAKMVGQENERYQYFGMFAVQLYNIIDFVPAYLLALCMLMTVSVLKMDRKNAKKYYLRECKKNRGKVRTYTEAVIAGALHVQLADTIWDSEEMYEKQLFEEDGRPVKPTDILRVNRLMRHCVTIALVLFVILKALIIILL